MIDSNLNLEGKDLCLLNTYFEPNNHDLFLKLYDLKENKLYNIKDASMFKGFCYIKKDDIDQTVLQKFLNEHNEFEVTLETKYDGIQNKSIEVYRFESYNVFNVYSLQRNYAEELGIEKTYEQGVKLYESFYLSNGLVPCAIYTCNQGRLELKRYPLNESAVHTLTKMTQNNNTINKIYNQYLAEYTELLSQPIPFVKRIAIDIEVYNKQGKFPDIANPTDPIVCCSFYDNENVRRVIVSKEHLSEKQLEEIKIENRENIDKIIAFCDYEWELIYNIFKIINQYPIILTYNGDQFDLAYICERSRKLKEIDQITNPIKFTADNITKKFGQRKDPVYLLNSIHIDLFRLFLNRSLHTYGFNNKYVQFGLEDVSQALLGEGKIKNDVPLNELSVNNLAKYCLRDSELTLRLTTYADELVMKLLFTIARITKSSIEDIDRYGISSWARSMLYFEHRKWNMLIPTKDEIKLGKGEGSTEAVIKGKKFQGAFVMEPKVGTYFNVVTMDYACFDDQTEILTSRGWQTIDTIQEGETCLSVNVENGNVENDIIEKVYKYDYNGELVNIKTDKKLDFLFTSNHRIVYHRKKGGYKSGFRTNEFKVDELQNIKYYHFAIPCFGNWIGQPKQDQIRLGNNFVFNTNEFFEFLGRFLGNGYLNVKQGTCQIYDNLNYKDRHVSIKSICENMGFKSKQFIEQHKTSMKTYICNKEFVNKLKILLGNKVHSVDRSIPKELLEYNKEHLQYLFKGLMESDGSTGINGEKTYCSVSKELAESFQILALKCGYNCYIGKHKMSITSYSTNNDYYYICTLSGFRQKKASFVVSKQYNHIQNINYKGKIWCASTKNTTLIIRRKGRVMITGNSLYPSIIKRYNISYETINCTHEKCKINNPIPQTKNHYCTKRTGLTSLIIGVIRDLRVNYFKKLSKDKNLTEDQRDLYDSITQASKVILNGSYGVVGSESFNLYCLPVAESVTALGRNIITKTIQYAEQKLGMNVIYSDTDSIFTNKSNTEQINSLIEFSKAQFDIDLEVDKEYKLIVFSERKKNYFGVHKETGKIETKGLTGKKSNIPIYIKNCFNEVGKLLSIVDNEEKLEITKSQIKELINQYITDLRNKKVDLNQLTFQNMLTQDIDNYGTITSENTDLFGQKNIQKKGVPIHVKIAEQMQKKTGEKIEEKTFIPYVKTMKGAKIVEEANRSEIDIDKYIDTMKTAVNPILEVLGLDFDSIAYNTMKQTSFDSMFFK